MVIASLRHSVVQSSSWSWYGKQKPGREIIFNFIYREIMVYGCAADGDNYPWS